MRLTFILRRPTPCHVVGHLRYIRITGPGVRDRRHHIPVLWEGKDCGVNLTIELPDELGAALRARAQAQGVSPDRYISLVLETTLSPDIEQRKGGPPFETGYGMWAKYGPAPSAEEIDENRREMFRNFGEDF